MQARVRGINIALNKIAPKLYEKNINLIWQTGVPDFKYYKDKYAPYSDKIKILDFIEKIAYAFSAADLVICRSGITSIMEIAYLELPAILIPLPTSARIIHECKKYDEQKGCSDAFAERSG